VAFMSEGKIIETNTVLGMMSNPGHPLLRAFLRSDKQKLSDIIREKNIKIAPGGLLVHLSFVGEITREPVLAEVIRNCQVDINILHGNIDNINDTPVGDLVVEMRGNGQDLEQALAMLRSKGIECEVEQC